VAAAIVLATASIRTGASTNTSTKCFICTRRPDGSGGDRTRLKTSLSAHHRVQLAWSSARCGIIIAVSAGRRTLPQASFRRSRPGHLTACARPSIHLHYYLAPLSPHCRTAVATRLSVWLLPAEPAIVLRPTTARRRFRFSSAQPACTRLATLVPLTLTLSLSPHHTLRRLAHARCRFNLPPDRLACFDCETLLPPPLLRFRFLRIPSSPSSDSGSRDFTFISGYLRFTLRRFTSQRPPLHARH
jgi:hypothetical protein